MARRKTMLDRVREALAAQGAAAFHGLSLRDIAAKLGRDGGGEVGVNPHLATALRDCGYVREDAELRERFRWVYRGAEQAQQEASQ